MGRPRQILPEGTEQELERIMSLEGELDRIAEERARLVLEMAENYGIAATARGLGVTEFVMHKRIARIRQTLGSVQKHEAA